MHSPRYQNSEPYVDPNQLKRLRLRIDTDDPIYPGMKKVKIRGKDLCDLPAGIFDLVELEVLDLSPERESCIYYRLPEVPSEIRCLKGLRVLMLDTNELDYIPQEICQLSQLERLSLSNNNLQELPENIGALSKLNSLHLSNNKLSKLPSSLTSLAQLQCLDLASNHLESLPGDIARMKNLESLIVVYNRLKDIPESICDMITLHVLWIGYNRISRLPRRLGNLVNLDWGFRHTTSLALEGNPLQDPPIEICMRGVEAIEEYFHSHGRVTDRYTDRM